MPRSAPRASRRTVDGRFQSVAITGNRSADTVGWSVVARPANRGAAVRTLVGAGPTARATWDGQADYLSVVADGSCFLTLAVFDAAGNPATQTWTWSWTLGRRSSA